MSNESGKWRALEIDNTTSHVYRQVTPRPPMSPPIQKALVSTENITKTLPENIQTLRFDTDVMERQKAMIATIKELFYTINTMVINLLATNDEERQRVRDRAGSNTALA